MEFLWGSKVSLYTHEAERVKKEAGQSPCPITEGPGGRNYLEAFSVYHER